jgi:phospholipase/lecithinase/hemolysin
MRAVTQFLFALVSSAIGLSVPATILAHSGAEQHEIREVVAFGDSLSDVGTYAYARNFGGGTYTTNPGPVSVAHIAAHYGTHLSPALTGGFGQPTIVHPKGLGYAQGGARVAAKANPGDATGDSGELQTPIAAQVAAFLEAHARFHKGQLVLMQGGANDVQDAYNAWAAMVASGAEPIAALQHVIPSVQQAARQLSELVHKVLENGATHVVLQNVPDVGKAPLADLAEHQLPGSARVLRQLVQVFNAALEDSLPSSPALLRINAFAFIDEASASYRRLGFRFDGSGGNHVACGPAPLPAAWRADANSALFCSPKTYVIPEADQLYMFADAYHPGARLQKLTAEYVISRADRWLERPTR